MTDIKDLRKSQPGIMHSADRAGRQGQKSSSAFFIREAIKREASKQRLINVRKPWPGASVRRADSAIESCTIWIGSLQADASEAVVGTVLDWTPPPPPEPED